MILSGDGSSGFGGQNKVGHGQSFLASPIDCKRWTVISGLKKATDSGRGRGSARGSGARSRQARPLWIVPSLKGVNP
jgi:hypothetical protein